MTSKFRPYPFRLIFSVNFYTYLFNAPFELSFAEVPFLSNTDRRNKPMVLARDCQWRSLRMFLKN